MPVFMIVWLTPVFLAAGAGGAGLLRRAWLDRRQDRPALLLGGWGLILIAALAGALVQGPVKGLALAVLMLSLGALLVVLAGAVRRSPRTTRERSLAPEPLEGPSRAWRGWLKALLAGPLGMTAAMAVAFCYSAWAPGDPRTRIVLGGLMMPILWGLAMTWTLADQKLLRATAVLAGTTIAGFGLAAVRGLL